MAEGPYYERGLYDFQVTNQGFGFTESEKNTPFFFLEGMPVAFVNGQERLDVPSQFNRTITLYITDGTRDFVVDKLVSIGWDGLKWSDMDPSENGKFDFRGTVISAFCSHKPGLKEPSRLFENWDISKPRTPKENDSSVARKLDALHGRDLKAKAKTKPKTVSRELAEEARAMGAADDDNPF